MLSKRDLAERLRQIRVELYGEHGGPELARLLGLPLRTWCNYENGVTIPGEVLLAWLDVTGIEPRWLLRGQGPMFCQAPLRSTQGRPQRAVGDEPQVLDDGT
jgi:hypothetical protein